MLLLFFGLIKVYSQSESSFNLGINLPIFFKSSLHWNVEARGNTGISGYGLFGERPFPIRNTKLHFTPGLFYTSYSEKLQGATSALGGNSYGFYKHKSIGLYNKFLIDVLEFFPLKNILYSGIYTGVHFYNTTKGQKSSFIYTNPPQYWSTSIDGNGKLFYNSFLFGVIVGVKPNYNRNLVVKPALELTFFPYYAKLLDYYTNRENLTKYNSMSAISLILGFSEKKTNQ